MKTIRDDFPLLKTAINGKPIVYFDNAATTQKPQAVLTAITEFLTKYNANIHRGVYYLTEHATEMYENARTAVAHFIGADKDEIVFTRNTTESINLVAATWASEHIKSGDEILISELEHHSNLLPWQWLAKKNNAVLKYIAVDDQGVLRLELLPSLISSKTKLISVSHISNALGTRNDIATIIRAAKSVGAKVLIDAAQSVPHERIDVHALDCDFLAFSGHKIMAPTAIGVLYIKKDLHDRMPPYQLGGGMTYQAGFYESKFLKVPYLLEAGTPAIAQAIGLHAAIEYFQDRFENRAMRHHTASLCATFIDALQSMNGVRVLGPVDQLKRDGHLVSFTVAGKHPHDIAAYLDKEGICVRAGHHCAQPLATKLGIDASLRTSFYAYNTIEEVNRCIAVLERICVL